MPRKKTHKEYSEELRLKSKKIVVVETYINSTTPIKHRCRIHNKTSIEKPQSVLKFGLTCCENRKHRLWDTDSWIESSKKLYGNKFDYTKTKYVDAFTSIIIGCHSHGYEKVNYLKHLKKILKKSEENNLGCSKCNYERNHNKQKISLFFKELQEKICVNCKKQKPVSDFSKSTSTSDGYYLYCRSCKSIKAKQLRNERSEKLIEVFKIQNPGVYINKEKFFNSKKIALFFPNTNEKICSKCKIRQNIIHFYRKKNSYDGFETHCKNCGFKAQKQYYKKKYKTFEGRIDDFLKNAKNSSKKRKHTFEINQNSLITLWEKQNKKCFYTGVIMTTQPNELYSVSLDRKDSNLGYTNENIVFSTNFVNRMKSDFQLKEFLTLCNLVNKKNIGARGNINSKIKFMITNNTYHEEILENISEKN